MPGTGPLVRRVEPSEAARGDVVVRPGRGRIEGRARRLDGSPARVRLALEVRLRLLRMSYGFRASQSAVETDADGRFAFAGVQEDTPGLALYCATPGFRTLPPPGGPELLRARDLEVVVIDDAEASGLTVEVEVLDAATGDAPATAPDVRLRRAGDRGYQPAFLAPGSRTVHRSQDPMDLGTWEVEVVADGYVTATTEVRVAPGRAATRVTVRLERTP